MPTRKRRGSQAGGDPTRSDEASSSDSQQQQQTKKRKKNSYDPAEVCQELYETLRSYKNSDGRLLCEPFIRVPKRRSDPEYYTAVTSPIDLLKIQHKLKSDEYTAVEQLTADVELMISNAKSYYKDGCEEYGDACVLWELYVETRGVLVGDTEGEAADRDVVKSEASADVDQDDEEDASSRDGHASSVADDDATSSYEQLLGFIVAAKEGGRSISNMFRILPPKSKYPEYFQVIKHPMDLHMIAQKIQSNEYTSMDDMTNDLNLMIQNAKSFNEPGSQIYKDACALRRVMQAKQQEVDEARCAAAPRPVRSERIRSRRSAAAPRPSSVLAALQPDEESEEDESGGEAEDGGGSSDEESACWLLYSAVRAYRNTAGHPISDPFVKLPNKKIYPDYYEEIKTPMSLMKIEKKIQNNRYASVEDLALDLDVMFENAKKYNRDESQLYKDAVSLQAVVRAKCRELFDTSQLGLPEETWPSGGEAGTTCITKSRRPAAETEEREVHRRIRRPPDNLLQRRLQLLSRKLHEYQVDSRSLINMFLSLPPRKDYPDYYQVISEPMDMAFIDAKIKADKYVSVHQCINDFELMFNNARHYNEETSEVYHDADLLEKVLFAKLRSLRPVDNSPVPHRAITGRSKPKRVMTPLVQKLQELYNIIRDYTDGRGRIMSTPFMKLPQKSEYPDYYEVIKRPIDMQRIMQRMLANQHSCIDDIVSDFVLMFDNACKYNEPDSLIYKDALTLQRLCLEKKQELCANDTSNRVPDVTANIQELLTNLFISTHNHADEEGRCYSDSFLELPSRLPEEEEEAAVRQMVDGDKMEAEEEEKPALKPPPSFEKIKRNLDRGRYQRIDRFQQDMFDVFQYARRVSPLDSQVYEDAAELQLFMIGQLEELCERGERVVTPALSYTQRHLAADLDGEREAAADRPARDDEKPGGGDAMGAGGAEGEQAKTDAAKSAETDDTVEYQDQTYRVGDFVYIEATYREKVAELHIVNIEKLWREESGEAWLSGCWFLRPNETFQLATRKYLPKEVFKSDIYDSAPFNKVVGKCFVMFVKDYFKLKPEGYEDKDVFVCESRYSSKAKSSKKIKVWQVPKQAAVALVARDQPLTPERVASQFAERPPGSAAADRSDVDDGQPLVLDVDREDVILETTAEGEPVCTYYEQYHAPTGWFKLGDYVYVTTDEDKPIITRIDKMWTGTVGEAYIHGPYFIPPLEVQHTPTRLFYQREVFLSAVEDTNPMTSIVDRCAVLSHREFCTERPTQVTEECVYLCESKYSEMEKSIKKFNKPLKRQTLSYKVCDDEIYFFKKPIIPHKEPSPLLLQASGLSPLDLLDESSQLTFESSFNDSCSQFGSGEYPDSQPHEMTSEKKKKPKKKSQISGYITYAAECRKDIQNQNPDLTFGEISKIVGAKWRGLAKSDKEYYEAKARRIQEQIQLKQAAAERAFNETMAANYPTLGGTQSPDSRASPTAGTPHATPGAYTGLAGFSPHPNNFQQYPHGLPSQGGGANPGQVAQMGPPALPPRPPSPLFVSVPPRTQRLLHSDAYLKYIEGLNADSRGVSNWQKSLNATPENTLLSSVSKLPLHWLENGVGHHDNAVNALWALRDLMMKDTLTLSRTLEFNQL